MAMQTWAKTLHLKKQWRGLNEKRKQNVTFEMHYAAIMFVHPFAQAQKLVAPNYYSTLTLHFTPTRPKPLGD
jgi:hypothetical protein